MQKRPNLAYFPRVSVLLAGIAPDFRCFLTTSRPTFLRVGSRLLGLSPWRAIDFPLSLLTGPETLSPRRATNFKLELATDH